MTETKTNLQILNELITNHIMTILNEEMSGWNRIHLYAIGDHWVAFERSAYALSRIFRDSLPITVLNLKNYPFPVIMCSVHYEEIEFGRHALSFAKKTLDYRLIKIDTINRDEYRSWHDDISWIISGTRKLRRIITTEQSNRHFRKHANSTTFRRKRQKAVAFIQ